MNPLSLIKQGIIDGDWEMVKDGYSKMTGESLSEPAKPAKNKGRAKKQIASVPESATTDKFRVKSAVGKPVYEFGNNFVPEKDLHSDVKMTKKEMQAMAKSKIRRPPARDYTAKIMCETCNREFDGDSRDYIDGTGTCQRCKKGT